MSKKKCLAIILILSFVLFPMTVLAFDLGVRALYWFPSFDGDVKVDEANIIGTIIDLENDLGIDDESFPCLEAFLGIGKHHCSLSYTNIDYSGIKTISKNMVFKGENYSISSLVDSSIEYLMIDFQYQYDFLDLENILAGFSIGSVIQLKYLDGDIRLKSSGIREQEDFTLPIPMLGLNLHIGILSDLLEARLRGVGVSYSGDMLYELVAEVSWTPFPFLDIYGGYKKFVIDIDEDDVVLDYDMSGPYIAVAVGF